MDKWLIVAPAWEYEITFSAGSASVQRLAPQARGLSLSGVVLDETAAWATAHGGRKPKSGIEATVLRYA